MAKTKRVAKKRAAKKKVARSERGRIPASLFAWPTKWDSISLTTKGRDGKPVTMEDGTPAKLWQATFTIYNLDGSPSRISVGTVGGRCRASTPFGTVEKLALAECRKALEKSGATKA